jgi:hypothetical protein
MIIDVFYYFLLIINIFGLIFINYIINQSTIKLHINEYINTERVPFVYAQIYPKDL